MGRAPRLRCSPAAVVWAAIAVAALVAPPCEASALRVGGRRFGLARRGDPAIWWFPAEEQLLRWLTVNGDRRRTYRMLEIVGLTPMLRGPATFDRDNLVWKLPPPVDGAESDGNAVTSDGDRSDGREAAHYVDSPQAIVEV